MVAGDRSSYYHLLETGQFVDFGSWQIALKGEIGKYLSRRKQFNPANTEQPRVDQGQADRAGSVQQER